MKSIQCDFCGLEFHVGKDIATSVKYCRVCDLEIICSTCRDKHQSIHAPVGVVTKLRRAAYFVIWRTLFSLKGVVDVPQTNEERQALEKHFSTVLHPVYENPPVEAGEIDPDDLPF